MPGFFVPVTRSLFSPSRPMEVRAMVWPFPLTSRMIRLRTVVFPAFLHMPMIDTEE